MSNSKKRNNRFAGISDSRYQRRWKPLQATMSLFVAAGTISALMLPAITMNQECKLQEHQHSAECAPGKSQLVCTYDSLGVHVHEDGCYDGQHKQICGLSDFVLHVHEDICYDDAGVLRCTFPEIESHEHDDTCYVVVPADAGHTHTDDCFVITYGECPQNEHAHSDDCYAWSEETSLLCGMEEAEGHSHGNDCYAWSEEASLLCGMEEAEGHGHGNDCHAWTTGETAVCGLEEGEEHTHEDGCFEQLQGELTCTTEEAEGHTHAEGCYGYVKGELICTAEESEGHSHADGCYGHVKGELTCTTEVHTHSDGCREKIRGDQLCMEAQRESAPAETVLNCGKEVILPHIHDEADCYAFPWELDENGSRLPTDPTEEVIVEMSGDFSLGNEALGGSEASEASETAETTEETTVPTEETTEPTEPEEKVLICGLAQVEVHQHTEHCVQEITCSIPEHLHTNDCFPGQELEEEDPASWETQFPSPTGHWSHDLVKMAKSQLGYAESTTNRIADEEGTLHGYTRYGHWAKTPHAPWNTLFLAFCMDHAAIPQESVPQGKDLASWLEDLAEKDLLTPAGEDSQPTAGDLVFLDRDGDTLADTAAVLVLTSGEDGEDTLCTIEGDYENAVAQLPFDAASLVSYVNLEAARQTWLKDNPDEKPYYRIHQGADFTVTARFGEDAAFPLDVTMDVRELDSSSQEFADYVNQIPDLENKPEIYSLRLFDVTFLDADGKELEPEAPVDIAIVYDKGVAPLGFDCTVVHFDEKKGPEVLDAAPVSAEGEGITGLEFSQDSFSVSALLISEPELEYYSSSAANSAKSASTTPNSSVYMDREMTDTYRRTTDYVTLNDWRESFINDENNINTSRAGGVFMDKSVTAGSVTFDNGAGSSGSVSADSGKFLVGLGTIASTQSAAGVESAPTDVMFILDLSSSMYSGETRTDKSVSALVDALNTSIDTLNGLNNYNRIGVTVYFGNSTTDDQSTTNHGFVMLPLRRYETTDNSDDYLVVTHASGKFDGVQVTNKVREINLDTGAASNPTYRNYSVPNNIAGTYAQLGILHAMNELTNDAYGTTVTIGNETHTRQPIFIFMSDGLPTAATNNFSVIENAVMGNNSNGCRSAWETDFVTMLTAAYAKDQVDKHYYPNKDTSNPNAPAPLFYTLGYLLDPDVGVSKNVMNPTEAIANHVSDYNMKYSNKNADYMDLTQAIINKWDELAKEPASGSVTISPYISSSNSVSSGYYSQKTFTVSKVGDFPSSTAQMEYVDTYFEATDTNGLKKAFIEITLEISLQQEYNVTMIHENDTTFNESGFVTFVDTIGEYMTVTDMEGIVYHGELHSGLTLAKNFSPEGQNSPDNILGSMANPSGTGLGVAFCKAVGTDLGLDPQFNGPGTGNADYWKTIFIIDAAYNVGQLYYNSDEDFGNYIEWYAAADGNGNHTFLGLAHAPGLNCNNGRDDLYTCESEGHKTSPPANATHRIRSYFHLGPLTPEANGTISHTNMMYSLVWHRTKLNHTAQGVTDGQESILFALPNSLIPTVDYTVKLDMDKSIYDLSVSGASSPAVLLYQAALREDVLVEDILENDPDYKGIVRDSEGNPTQVYFYSNDFVPGQGNEYNTTNTHAYFNPNEKNDRYYYTGPITEKEGSPTPIYVDNGDGTYSQYSGERPVANPMYVEKFVYYTKINGQLETHIQWKPISAHAFSQDDGHDHLVQDANGYWYVNAGTAHDMETSTIDENYYFMKEDYDGKEDNRTGTTDWVEVPYVNVAGTTAGSYLIGTMQGNNGRLMVDPFYFSGTKSLAGVDLSHEDNANFVFDFEIHKTDSSFDTVCVETDANGLRSFYSTNHTLLYAERKNADGDILLVDPMGKTLAGTKRDADNNILTDSSGKHILYTYENGSPTETVFSLAKSTVLESTTNKDFAADELAGNEGKDKIQFSAIWPAHVGTHYYVVSEHPTDGISCDGTEYLITVHVGNREQTRITSIKKRGTDMELLDPNVQNPTSFADFVFVNELGVELPETGGVGSELYIFCGLSFMAAAAVVYLLTRKKEKGVRF